MIKFKELSELEVSDFIVNDPMLAYMGFNDAELVQMHEHSKYVLHPGSYYIGFEKEGKLIGILKWEYFSDVCVSVHLYVSSRLHGKGVAQEISEFVIKHLTLNTDIIKVLAFIIEPCVHAIKSIKIAGFKQEAYIPNCQKWRKEVTGMYVFGYDLERG